MFFNCFIFSLRQRDENYDKKEIQLRNKKGKRQRNDQRYGMQVGGEELKSKWGLGSNTKGMITQPFSCLSYRCHY